MTLDANQFLQCNWGFEGPAAMTLEFLNSIYHGAGEGGKALIETTFENIRKGTVPSEPS